MNSAGDILRINFKSKERRRKTPLEESPMHRFIRHNTKSKSKSKSRSRKYLMKHDAKMRKTKQLKDLRTKNTRARDYPKLDKLLQQRRKQTRTERQPLSIKKDFSNLVLDSKAQQRNRTRSPFRDYRKTLKSPSFANLSRKDLISLVSMSRNIRS